jgi:hypothetical protein
VRLRRSQFEAEALKTFLDPAEGRIACARPKPAPSGYWCLEAFALEALLVLDLSRPLGRTGNRVNDVGGGRAKREMRRTVTSVTAAFSSVGEYGRSGGSARGWGNPTRQSMLNMEAVNCGV